jgi:hypothetical protein
MVSDIVEHPAKRIWKSQILNYRVDIYFGDSGLQWQLPVKWHLDTAERIHQRFARCPLSGMKSGDLWMLFNHPG